MNQKAKQSLLKRNNMKAIKNYTYLTFLIVGLLCSNVASFAQSNQFEANPIGKTVNSEYDELNPVFSADGKTIYFVRVNHPENGYGVQHHTQDIWYTTLQEDGTWSEAKRLESMFNHSKNNAIVSVTNGGRNLIVTGLYTKKHGRWRKRGLSITHQSDTLFTIPEKLEIPRYQRINKGKVSNTFCNDEETVVLLAFTRKWNGKNLKLYVSTPKANGKYSPPKKLSKNLRKTFKTIESPFLSNDGEYLYFSAYKHGKENKGKYDIYRCQREDDTYRNWSEPELLNDTINSPGWDGYFKTNEKGNWGVFASNRPGSQGSDIYIIKLFEEKPYITVKGNIYNKAFDSLAASNLYYEIMINDVVQDTVEIDRDKAYYQVNLPYQQDYKISAVLKDYDSKMYPLDFSHDYSHREVTQDLTISPYPFVELQGKLLNSNTNEYINDKDIKIAINGQVVDSIVPEGGLYEIKLPWGEKYEIQIASENFTPTLLAIDLTDVKGYQLIEKNLIAEPLVAYAIIQGKVLNGSTNEPIKEKVFVDINDKHNPSTRINQETGEYTTRLPLGAEHTISASANKFFPIYETLDLRFAKENETITKDLYLAPIVVGAHVRLNNIFFEMASTNLDPKSYHDLDKVAEMLSEYATMKIEIGGHTDNVGKEAYNQKLSENRAKAVKDYITSKGIDASRVTYKGYGESSPVAENKTEEGKAKNRRVEFTILEQ